MTNEKVNVVLTTPLEEANLQRIRSVSNQVQVDLLSSLILAERKGDLSNQGKLDSLFGEAEVVYGSRFLGGPRKAMMFWHMVANMLLTLMTNVMYNTILSDMETGYKVFKAEVIKHVPLRARRFDFEPEVTAKMLKRRHYIYEVPISFNPREYAEGKKIGLRDAFVAVWTLFKYRFVD